MQHLDRRSFLGLAGAGLTLTTPGLASSLTLAEGVAEPRRGPTLAVIFLRGGLDGLNLVVPHGEQAYHRLRPSLAIRRPGEPGGALDLDGFFGLHPAAAPLLEHFESGTGCAVHAVGSSANTRSHFEEQDRWETAIDGSELETSGWLGRHLVHSEARGPVRAIALGENLTRSLRGEVTTLALRGLDDLVPRGSAGDLERTLAALDKAYGRRGRGPARGSGNQDRSGAGMQERGRAANLLEREGRASLDALALLEDVARNPPASRVEYPGTDLARRARELSRLVRADLGLEVASLDLGGWDTHQNQGAAQGQYSGRVAEVAGAIDALLRDLEDRLDEVLVLVVSEFGRTAAQNGTGGTDHGNASCVLAFGGAVRAARATGSGPVLGTWPGLEREQLNQQRDLRHTTDYRDVYAECLRFHGHEVPAPVLAGHEAVPLGLVRPS